MRRTGDVLIQLICASLCLIIVRLHANKHVRMHMAEISSQPDDVGCPCDDPWLCFPIRQQRANEVMSFSLSSDGIKGYDWTQLSSVAWNMDPQLMCLAHANRARVILNAGNVRQILGSEESRSAWVRDHVGVALVNYMDGTNFDLEDDITPEEAANYTALVAEAARVFKVSILGAQISVDVPWSPFDVDGRNYDWKGLAEAADIFFVMAYDMQSQMFGRCVAAANSPLHLVEKGLKQWIALGIPPSKLVLGLPWYGYDYPCQPEKEGQPVPADTDLCILDPIPFRGAPCSDAAGFQRCYSDIMQSLASGQNITEVRTDPLSSSSYFNYKHEDGSIHQVWFDSVDNLKAKYELVAEYQLRGTGFWMLDCLGYGSDDPVVANQTKEMWTAVQTAFKPQQAVASRTHT